MTRYTNLVSRKRAYVDTDTDKVPQDVQTNGAGPSSPPSAKKQKKILQAADGNEVLEHKLRKKNDSQVRKPKGM